MQKVYERGPAASVEHEPVTIRHSLMLERELFDLLCDAGFGHHIASAIVARVVVREAPITVTSALRVIPSLSRSTIVVGRCAWRRFTPKYARCPKATLIGEEYHAL